jgi:hypothetical protein
MVRIEPSLGFADWSAAPKRAFEAVQLQIGNAEGLDVHRSQTSVTRRTRKSPAASN